jgi:hypothetical protein
LKRHVVLLAGGWLLLFNPYPDKDRPITEWSQSSVHDTALECQRKLYEGIKLAKSIPELDKQLPQLSDPLHYKCVPPEVLYLLPEGRTFAGGWVVIFNQDKSNKLPFHEWEKKYSLDTASQCDRTKSRFSGKRDDEDSKAYQQRLNKEAWLCVPSEVAYPAKSK